MFDIVEAQVTKDIGQLITAWAAGVEGALTVNDVKNLGTSATCLGEGLDRWSHGTRIGHTEGDSHHGGYDIVQARFASS